MLESMRRDAFNTFVSYGSPQFSAEADGYVSRPKAISSLSSREISYCALLGLVIGQD